MSSPRYEPTTPAGISTRSVHSGAMPEAHTGSVVAPIFQTSTYQMDTPGETRAGFDYARTGTPNRSDLEEALCELENASFAAAVNSGTSAEVAVFSALLGPGDEVILPRDVYGGTFRLLQNEYVRWGVVIRTVDFTDTAALAAAINERTAIIWVETPSNPGLDVIEIAEGGRTRPRGGNALLACSTRRWPHRSCSVPSSSAPISSSTRRRSSSTAIPMSSAVPSSPATGPASPRRRGDRSSGEPPGFCRAGGLSVRRVADRGAGSRLCQCG